MWIFNDILIFKCIQASTNGDAALVELQGLIFGLYMWGRSKPLGGGFGFIEGSALETDCASCLGAGAAAGSNPVKCADYFSIAVNLLVGDSVLTNHVW